MALTPCTYCSECTTGWLCLACIKRELSEQYEQTCVDCGQPNDGWFGECCDDCDLKRQQPTERVA